MAESVQLVECTPRVAAMLVEAVAEVLTKLWSLTDIVRMIEDWETARSTISGKTLVG